MPRALALMSQSASSMPAIALWVTPPRFWRVARSMSQYRRSTGRGSWPISSGARSRTEPAMPYGLRLSLHSPQPTRPSSVSTRTKVQGRQPPSQCRASTRAIFMATDHATAGGRGQATRSRPRARTLAELLKGEQADPVVRAGSRPGRLRVVAPGSEEEAHVVQIRMRGHVLERLETVLHEGEPGPAPVLGLPGRDQRAEIQAFVHARLLALHVREPHAPAVEDAPREGTLLGRDQHASRRLGHEAAELVDAPVWSMERDPARLVGGDPLAPHLVERVAEAGDQRVAGRRPRRDELGAHPLPAAQDLRARNPSRDGAEEHRHLPAAQDHRAQRAERHEGAVGGRLVLGPHPQAGTATRLEVLTQAVTADTIEVERQDVGNRHRRTPH